MKNLLLMNKCLRRWAIEAFHAEKFAEDGLKFKANRKFIIKFKQKVRIGKRQITKFVARVNSSAPKPDKTLVIKQFFEGFHKLVKREQLALHQIVNVDHSRFQYEIHSGITLSIKGAKKIELDVQSTNSLTRTYTIMPAITAAGTVQGDLFVQIKERGSKFPPNASFSCNIKAVAALTYIMTRNAMSLYF